MNTLELYIGATFLRGAFAVLLLLGAERILRYRLDSECRRRLWLFSLVVLVIPQMSVSVLPVKLDLSEAAAPMFRCIGSAAGNLQADGSAPESRRISALSATWRFCSFHRRKIEAAALVGLPLPALLLLLMRYLRCRRMVRQLPPVTDLRVLELWTRVLRETGPLRRPVILLDSSVIGPGPTLFGCFRRKLLLPIERLKELSDKELSLLLEHEYLHCRSGDDLLNMAALMIWAVFWYNPFLLIVRRKIRSSCELACDHELLRRHPESVREYGMLLLKFASNSAGTVVAIGLSNAPHELSRRIRGMTGGRVVPMRRRRLLRWGVVLLLGGLMAAPSLLVAVDVRPARNSPPIREAQADPRPPLPYLTFCEFLERSETGEAKEVSWLLDYSDPFPAAGSRLILEFRGMRHPIPLDRKPRWIRLLHNGDAATEKWHWETSAQQPPSLRKERGVERRVIPADRNPVYISVPESAVPAALLLEIEGITPGNLDEFRHP